MAHVRLNKGSMCVSLCALLVIVTVNEFVVPAETATIIADAGEVREYCATETIQARCRWNSEVIMVTSALWGRMRTGRCLSIHPSFMLTHGQDPLFLGCSADVQSVMDEKCSGRSQCDVLMTDPDLDKVTPCYKDLARYLETSYSCVRVVQESRSCVVSVTTDSEFISSLSSSATASLASSSSSSSSCGSVSHPWRLEAAAGQRINISLIDFAASVVDRNGASRDVGDVGSSCRQYGYVLEKWNKRNISLCAEGGAEQRERAVYTSENNNVEIVFTIGETKPNFLIRNQAVGCTNIVPPDNAWLKRSNNDIIIGCYSSQQTWRLQCDGHNWKGTIGLCPELYAGTHVASQPVKTVEEDNHVVLITMVVIVGAALIICITVVTVGCLCLQRYKQSSVKKLGAPPSVNNTFVRLPVAADTQRQHGLPPNYTDEQLQFMADTLNAAA